MDIEEIRAKLNEQKYIWAYCGGKPLCLRNEQGDFVSAERATIEKLVDDWLFWNDGLGLLCSNQQYNWNPVFYEFRDYGVTWAFTLEELNRSFRLRYPMINIKTEVSDFFAKRHYELLANRDNDG